MAARSKPHSDLATPPEGEDAEWLITPEFAELIGKVPAFAGYFGDRCDPSHAEHAMWTAAREMVRNLRHRMRAVGLTRSAASTDLNSLHHETYRLVIHNLVQSLRFTDHQQQVNRFCAAVRCFARLPTLDTRRLSQQNRHKAQKPRPRTAGAAMMTPKALVTYMREEGFKGKNVKVFHDKAASHFDAPEGRVRATWALARKKNLHL
jgi:hypothetical protein